MKPWDMAAGLLMVREAGGYATDPAGGDPRTAATWWPPTRTCIRLLDAVGQGMVAAERRGKAAAS